MCNSQGQRIIFIPNTALFQRFKEAFGKIPVECHSSFYQVCKECAHYSNVHILIIISQCHWSSETHIFWGRFLISVGVCACVRPSVSQTNPAGTSVCTCDEAAWHSALSRQIAFQDVPTQMYLPPSSINRDKTMTSALWILCNVCFDFAPSLFQCWKGMLW